VLDNFSSYVLRVLRESAAKVQQNFRLSNKSVVLEGCLLFLPVCSLFPWKLKTLNMNTKVHDHAFISLLMLVLFWSGVLSRQFKFWIYDAMPPRIGKYTHCLVSELVSYDRGSKMAHKSFQFGHRKVNRPW